jgi:hypothetical protein
MNRMQLKLRIASGLAMFVFAARTLQAGTPVPDGFAVIFNGTDLSAFKIDSAAAEHWTLKDGVLDYDNKGGHLWTKQSFGDFELRLEWRWSGKPTEENHPVFDADGNEVIMKDGKVKTERMLDGGDSGVFMRGYTKAQANLFCYPCGSGEVWEYRTDRKMPVEVRKAVMPRKRADKPVGEWNQMTITLVGDRLTVIVNGEEVIAKAQLPGVPARGPIGLQHEFGTVQFRNIFIKEVQK